MSSPLIGVEELVDLLAGEHPPVLWDVRWYLPEPDRGERDYLAGHLSGSFFVGIETDLSDPVRADRRGGRHPLPSASRIDAALARTGVSAGREVIVLDQGSGLSAARAWWVLSDAGIAPVRVLNGGVAAWVAAGRPLTTELPVPVRTDQQPARANPGQRAQFDADQLVAAQAAGATVVDVRAAERFSGAVEPIDPVAGHIPGAINHPATQLAGASGFVDPDLVRAQLGDLKPGDVFSCGSGITAAQALLAAESAGITGLAIYPGSWSDWTSDPSRPVAKV